MPTNRISPVERIKLAKQGKKIRLAAMFKQAQQIETITNNFLAVSDSTIAKRQQQYQQEQQNQLNNIVDLIAGIDHPAIKPLLSVYCHKSGRYLYSHPNTVIEEMLHLHGIEQTKTYLEMHNRNAVCPLMLRTDSEALRQIFFRDPKDYFVYAGIELLHKHDKENKYNLTIESRQNLNKITSQPEYNETALIRCNEYLRRLLGLISSSNFLKLKPMAFLQSLPAYCTNIHGIQQFTVLLQRALAYIVEEQLKRTQQQIIKKQSILITDIAEISARYNGEKRFRDQKQIKNLHDSEALQIDIEAIFFDGELNNFDDFQFTVDFEEQLKKKQKIQTQQLENKILEQTTKPLQPGECFITITASTASTATESQQPATNPFLSALLKK